MRKLILSFIAVSAIVAINTLPFQDLIGQTGRPPKGMVELQCPDGSGLTYWACLYSQIPCNTTFPNNCPPGNN